MTDLLASLAEYNDVRFSAYRTALKLRSVQKAIRCKNSNNLLFIKDCCIEIRSRYLNMLHHLQSFAFLYTCSGQVVTEECDWNIWFSGSSWAQWQITRCVRYDINSYHIVQYMCCATASSNDFVYGTERCFISTVVWVADQHTFRDRHGTELVAKRVWLSADWSDSQFIV